MERVDLQIQSYRISSTQGINGTSKRSPGESPVLIVKQKPEALDQTNSTLQRCTDQRVSCAAHQDTLVLPYQDVCWFVCLVLFLEFVLGGVEVREHGEGGGCMMGEKGRNT